MNFVKFSPRISFFLGFAACGFLLLMGAYLQFVENLEPCPLCISQRLAIFATGILYLLAGFHNRAPKIYSVVIAITASIGASISLRHVWLQNLPRDQVPECSPGLEYVFQHFPLSDTIKLMLTGTGECADIDWTLLGLSIPVWTLFAFICLAAWALLQIKNTHPIH
jgi:protein dithiol:quinone oxidoreductase